MQTLKRFDRKDWLILLGILMLSAGLALVEVRIMLIVDGVLLTAIGLIGAVRGHK